MNETVLDRSRVNDLCVECLLGCCVCVCVCVCVLCVWACLCGL